MPRNGAMFAVLVVVLVAAGCGGNEERAPADLVEDAGPDWAVAEVAPTADQGSETAVASEAEPSEDTVADATQVRLPGSAPEPPAAFDTEPQPEAAADPSPPEPVPESSEPDAPVKSEPGTAPATESEPEPTTWPEAGPEPVVEPAEPEPAVVAWWDEITHAEAQRSASGD